MRPTRLRALRDALARADLDALLVSAPSNIRYLTRFSGTNGLVLVTARDVTLLTDFRYDTQVREEAGDAATIRIEPASLWVGLWSVLGASVGVERVGFETTHLLHRDFARLLEQGSRWQWRPAEDLIERLRERKDATEIAAIERAVAVAERALGDTLPQIAAGQSETEIAGLLERELRRHGSEAFPFPTIVASGPRSALPHARASSRVVEIGELLLVDFGAVVDGYCSDITRTFVMGTATASVRELYEIVADANARASGAVRAGMRGMAADAVAREYIDARGHGDAFGHSLGHGIGLDVHEAPRLAKTSDTTLPEGAVVTIEPGVYLPGVGGVRIEDDVLLTGDGPRVLTSFPRSLIALG